MQILYRYTQPSAGAYPHRLNEHDIGALTLSGVNQ